MKPTALLNKLELLSGKNALDIGARNCSDAIDLVNAGFIVDALDIKDCPPQCNIENVRYIRTRFEDFQPDKKYDLIIARHVIPFLNNPIESSLEKILEMLTESGVLYFTAFGEDDEWSSNLNVKITNLPNIINGITKYGKVVYEAEERYEGKTYSGDAKKWHIITVVVVRV